MVGLVAMVAVVRSIAMVVLVVVFVVWVGTKFVLECLDFSVRIQQLRVLATIAGWQFEPVGMISLV